MSVEYHYHYARINLGVGITLAILMPVAVALRVAARYINGARLGFDDYTIFVTLVGFSVRPNTPANRYRFYAYLCAF